MEEIQSSSLGGFFYSDAQCTFVAVATYLHLTERASSVTGCHSVTGGVAEYFCWCDTNI